MFRPFQREASEKKKLGILRRPKYSWNKALDHYAIRGVTHNIPLLRDILTEPTFLSGTFTTNYLNEVYPEGFQGYKLTQVFVGFHLKLYI